MADFSLEDKHRQERTRREAEINAACKRAKRRAWLIGLPVMTAILALFAVFFVLFGDNNDVMVWTVVVGIVVLVGITFTFKQIVAACGAAEARKREQLELLDGSTQSTRFHL